jgi:hypothetical protein
LIAPLREAAAQPRSFERKPCNAQDPEKKINDQRCGTYHAYENRQTQRGRMLPLEVILLPTRKGRSDRGGCYGSRAAIAYIKMLEAHVSRANLADVFPFKNPGPLDLAEDQRNALDAVFGGFEQATPAAG